MPAQNLTGDGERHKSEHDSHQHEKIPSKEIGAALI